ncbi:CDP-diacylglycerol--inositol 3-phosphatidyltransferase 1-like [Asterias rubens]|uniref:CDP-diacylglycerol--inositol 3-phosphatidyltransferase 1-like n=1 Tax=Asterias rubens TaxID=7604 RepID=UPI0014554BBB|nr:CDP-diacylglycerol--inositol 3-phosphatidyltransferase 1-like [Asterias rubens]
MSREMADNIYLYVPNVIGYVRLLLIVLAWFYLSYPLRFIGFYLTSVILDDLDGAVARRLHQTSTFGAWLDVVIDNIGRGMIWSQVFQWGCFVSALEWCVLVCTHTAGAQWKSSYSEVPWLVRKVMANGFRTPIGLYTVWCLHLLPLWLYAHKTGVLTAHIPRSVVYFVIGILVFGRAVCATVEVYCIWAHIQQLINTDMGGKNVPKGEKDQHPELLKNLGK